MHMYVQICRFRYVYSIYTPGGPAPLQNASKAQKRRGAKLRPEAMERKKRKKKAQAVSMSAKMVLRYYCYYGRMEVNVMNHVTRCGVTSSAIFPPPWQKSSETTFGFPPPPPNPLFFGLFLVKLRLALLPTLACRPVPDQVRCVGQVCPGKNMAWIRCSGFLVFLSG